MANGKKLLSVPHTDDGDQRWPICPDKLESRIISCKNTLVFVSKTRSQMQIHLQFQNRYIRPRSMQWWLICVDEPATRMIYPRVLDKHTNKTRKHRHMLATITHVHYKQRDTKWIQWWRQGVVTEIISYKQANKAHSQIQTQGEHKPRDAKHWSEPLMGLKMLWLSCVWDYFLRKQNTLTNTNKSRRTQKHWS